VRVRTKTKSMAKASVYTMQREPKQRVGVVPFVARRDNVDATWIDWLGATLFAMVT
jgi:hypothetical protein